MQFEVDNNMVTSALRSGSCRDTQVMHLLRLVHFVAAERRFSYLSQHIPKSEDVLADAISKNLMSRLFSLQLHLSQSQYRQNSRICCRKITSTAHQRLGDFSFSSVCRRYSEKCCNNQQKLSNRFSRRFVWPSANVLPEETLSLCSIAVCGTSSPWHH